MAASVSRRKLAEYCTGQIIAGEIKMAMKQLAAYLIETGREREADLIIRDIEGMLADRGTILATVTTAHPLSAALRSTLADLLKGKTVHMREIVDESVLGGVRIELPGKLYDATVKRKLESLKELSLT